MSHLSLINNTWNRLGLLLGTLAVAVLLMLDAGPVQARDYQRSRQWNRDAGTWQSYRSITGAGGRTAERTKYGVRNENGSYTVQGNGTTWGGRSTTLNRQITPMGGQTYGVSTDRTRGNRSLSTDQSVTRTGSGRSSSGTYQTGGNRSGTFETDVTHSEGNRTKTQTVTNQNNLSATKTTTYQRTDTGIDRNVTVTGPQGNTAVSK